MTGVFIFEIGAALFGSLLLIGLGTARLFFPHRDRAAQWNLAAWTLVTAGIGVWNWISMLRDIVGCRSLALNIPKTMPHALEQSIASVCVGSLQLHVNLQFVAMLALFLALIWTRKGWRSSENPTI